MNPGKPRAANPYEWLSFKWAGGWVRKGEACLGFDKINNNAEDVCASSVAPWAVRQDAMFCALVCVCGARALSSFHVDTFSFPRDKTGLTMG